MDSNMLSTMKRTVQKAETLLNNIKKIDDIIDKVKISGKVDHFEISYPSISEGGFGSEPGDSITRSMVIDARSLGMTEKDYSEMYKQLIISSLEKQKKEYQNQYEDLK